jgi:peptide/nickel transport system substrate-binding protein
MIMNVSRFLKRCAFVSCALSATLAIGVASAAAQGQPMRGGKLVASVLELPQSLDPLLGNSASIDPLTLGLIYDTLMTWSTDGSYKPNLAESWAFSNGGKALTLRLRSGVTFHDGTPFNAEAVVFNLDRVTSTKVNSPYRSMVSVIESSKAVDPLTVEIALKSPSGAIIGALTSQPGMMASPAAVIASGQDFGRKPVGTGPFMFAAWPSGGDVSVTKNPKYWRDGSDGKPLPYLDAVTMRGITNSSVKLVELETGNIQLVDNIVPREFERVEKTKGMELVPANIGVQQWYAVNTTRPPFNDIRVRRALQYALDRQQMITIVAQGRGEILPAMFTKNEWVYEGDVSPYTFDQRKARALLAEAGYATGLEIELTSIQREPDTTVAQIILSQLAQVGIKAKLDFVDRQAFIAKNEAAKHQMSMGISPIPRGDPDDTFTVFFSRTGYARSGEPLLDVADLVEQGRAEVDQSKRKAIYRDAQIKILDHAAYGWLFLRQTAYVKRSELKNVEVNPAGLWRLEQVWFQK